MHGSPPAYCDMEAIDSFLGYQLIVGSVLIKYAIRLAFRTGCWTSRASNENFELRQRIFFLLEHTIFSIWGFYAIILAPGAASWYFKPQLCWVYPPRLPSDVFNYFYIAKVGTHVEDVAFRLYEAWQSYSSARVGNLATEEREKPGSAVAESPARADVMMDIHHFATAALCILSYTSGKLLFRDGTV